MSSCDGVISGDFCDGEMISLPEPILKCNGETGCFKSKDEIFNEKNTKGGSMAIMMKKLKVSKEVLEREKGKQNDSYNRYLLKKKRCVIYSNCNN